MEISFILVIIIIAAIIFIFFNQRLYDNSEINDSKIKYLLIVLVLLIGALLIATYKIGEINGHNNVVNNLVGLETINKNLAELHTMKTDLNQCGWTRNCINSVKYKYRHNPMIQKIFNDCMKCNVCG